MKLLSRSLPIFLLSLWISAITGLYAQAPVAYYPFTGSAKDLTTFANHASVNGASLTQDRFGMPNAAFAFDGLQSGIKASNAAHLNSPNTTISFWVKPNSFPAQGEVFLLSFGGWQERWKISMPNHGKPVFTTHSGGACCSDMDAGTPLTIGTWTHVAMVHDGTKDLIYFNGVKVNEKNVTGALDATVHPLGIGYDPIDNANYFDGALDEVILVDVALSAAEIAALYAAQQTAPVIAQGLVASYSFGGDGSDGTAFGNHADASSGTLACDRFGFGNSAFVGDGSGAGAKASNGAHLNSPTTTISFWVKPNELPAQGEVFLISNGGWQERCKISLPSHGKPVFTTHSGGACCSDMDAGTPLVVGAWTHVVMVHDGAKDIIYYNGVQVNEKNVTGTLDKTKHPLGIGYDPIDNGGYFDGKLDDVAIINRALSAAEIAALYATQNTAPMVPGSLVANYTFGGSGDDATDYNNHSSGTVLGKDRFGKSNNAAAFNGISTEVTAANSPQLNSPFTTVSFWVKLNTLPSNGESFLLSFGGWQERWKISLPQHGKPVWTTNHSGGISDMDSGTGNELAVGVWKHVVMVHDGAKDIIYMNGAMVAEKIVVGTLNNTTKTLGLGYNAVDGGNVLDGVLDEVQIYNNALSAAEIAALYALQNQPTLGGDIEAPCAPLNIVGTVDFNNIGLTWLPAMDNVGVVAYNVYQNSVLVTTTANLDAYFALLTPLTPFVFGISAVDATGNESLITTIQITTGPDATPDTEAPTVPANLAGTAAANSVLISWDASTDNVQVAGYVISVDGVFFDSVGVGTLSVFIGGLDPSTLYTFEVYAFDLAGNNSAAGEITLSTTQPVDTGEPGLIAHYPFDGNANDATPYANHGAIGGNPIFEVPNHPLAGGQNIRFDGTQDSVLVPNAVQLISDYATISFWIRVDSTNIADAEAYIIDFGHWDQRFKISLPQHLKIVFTTNSNNVQFTNFISDMDSGDGNEMVKGFWWYVTMVHDGTNDVVYVNGLQTKIKPTDGKLNTTARPLAFGCNPIEGGQYFIGALDNVKLYNKSLTAAEVLTLYNTGTTGLEDLGGILLKEFILQVSPNPTTDALNIKHTFDGKQPILIRVFDQLGRQVDAISYGANEVPLDNISLNVRHLTPGIYTVSFAKGGKNLGGLQFNKM